jgi:hypothetical protein
MNSLVAASAYDECLPPPGGHALYPGWFFSLPFDLQVCQFADVVNINLLT